MLITKHQADYRWMGKKERPLNEEGKRRNMSAFNTSEAVIRFIAVEHWRQVPSKAVKNGMVARPCLPLRSKGEP